MIKVALFLHGPGLGVSIGIVSGGFMVGRVRVKTDVRPMAPVIAGLSVGAMVASILPVNSLGLCRETNATVKMVMARSDSNTTSAIQNLR